VEMEVSDIAMMLPRAFVLLLTSRLG